MSTSIERRIAAIVTELHTPGACATCHGYPMRIVCTDPDTGEPWHEDLPESGCPDCGKPIHREYQIVMADDGIRPVPDLV